MALAVMAGCGSTNPVAEGDPIPNSKITSCGDMLLDLAQPAGSVAGGEVVVTPEATTLSGAVILQASCPKGGESSAETQFRLDRIELYEDDAGFPGKEMGSTAFSLESVLSCSSRANLSLGGTSKEVPFEPVALPSLADRCAAHLATPTGSALSVHVEMSGETITCSSQTASISFRSKIAVTCEGF